MNTAQKTSIRYDRGQLLIRPAKKHELAEDILRELCEWDSLRQSYHAPAIDYRKIITRFHESQIQYEDLARQYQLQSWELKEPITPRRHQIEALKAWELAGRNACLCLPTGAGKSILAILSIAKLKRPTLILVPTIDLMWQWASLIQKFFGQSPGLLGGGEFSVKEISIATYDSGHLHIDEISNRFAYLIFDEVHHLPAPQYRKIAMSAIAPFRMGLSATIERADGLESVIYELVGPLVYTGDLHTMVGHDLAPYSVKTVKVRMSESEKAAYLAERSIYQNFVKANHIVMNGPEGWQNFIKLAGRSAAGREAMRAFRAQKNLAQGATSKLEKIWDIIQKHPFEKIILFTNENAMAYQIGTLFFLPVLTHLTKAKERKQILEEFKQGRINVIVTSRVLNEGVDVPDASIGVVVSGTSTVREHVQRLGRILRASKGKQALLYELVTENTSETLASRRRRQHHAYQRSH